MIIFIHLKKQQTLKQQRMKKLTIFILFIFIFSFISFAQNYQTITSNRISYFLNHYESIICFRIDSTEYSTDSIFYPFSNIEELDYDCFTPYGASWIGKKVIIKKNGDNIFFNKNLDSVIIKTKAALNETWTVFFIPDSVKIIAEVTKHDTMSFLGLIDSVKTISFQVYDKNNTIINHNLNAKQLQISKSYGFVKIFNFVRFNDPYELYEYELVGINNPKAGVQNLTMFDAFDFQVGDEIHIFNSYSYWIGFSNSGEKKEIYKYLQRDNFPDSIVYVYSLKKNELKRVDGEIISFEYIYDTIKKTIKPDNEFDRYLPGELIITSYDASYFTMGYFNNILSKTYPSVYNKIQQLEDSCWRELVADGCFFTPYYLKGLGGPYDYCQNGPIYSDERVLVYYKKGESTWGTPLVVSDIPEKNIANNINVFPNPAREYIRIQMEDISGSIVFELMSTDGRIVLSKTLHPGSSQIGTENLKPGIYFYRIINNNGVMKTSKIVVE